MMLALALLALLGGAAYAVLLHPFGERREATLLLLGVDEGKEGSARSDTLILLRVQLRPHREAVALWLPRDTRVSIPGRSGHHKLNAAFALGGWPLLRETLARELGVRPDYHLSARSAGLQELVDALGGLTLEVPMAMDYEDHAQDLSIHLKPGVQHLSGEEAVGFVRYRSDGLGDLGRIERQQAFIRALIAQGLRPASLWRLPRVLAALKRAFETDLRIWQWMGVAYHLWRLSFAQIQYQRLPGQARYIRGTSYFVPATTQVYALLRGKAAESEGAASGGPLEASSTPSRPVAVLNGCGGRGYARQAARQLKAAGLAIAEVGNAPARDYRRTLILSAPPGISDALARQIRAALGCGRVVDSSEARMDGAVVVILGEDFRPREGT